MDHILHTLIETLVEAVPKSGHRYQSLAPTQAVVTLDAVPAETVRRLGTGSEEFGCRIRNGREAQAVEVGKRGVEPTGQSVVTRGDDGQ